MALVIARFADHGTGTSLAVPLAYRQNQALSSKGKSGPEKITVRARVAS